MVKDKLPLKDEKTPHLVDNFSIVYARQNRNIHTSKGMVQGFYQHVGKVKESEEKE